MALVLPAGLSRRASAGPGATGNSSAGGGGAADNRLPSLTSTAIATNSPRTNSNGGGAAAAAPATASTGGSPTGGGRLHLSIASATASPTRSVSGSLGDASSSSLLSVSSGPSSSSTPIPCSHPTHHSVSSSSSSSTCHSGMTSGGPSRTTSPALTHLALPVAPLAAAAGAISAPASVSTSPTHANAYSTFHHPSAATAAAAASSSAPHSAGNNNNTSSSSSSSSLHSVSSLTNSSSNLLPAAVPLIQAPAVLGLLRSPSRAQIRTVSGTGTASSTNAMVPPAINVSSPPSSLSSSSAAAALSPSASSSTSSSSIVAAMPMMTASSVLSAPVPTVVSPIPGGPRLFGHTVSSSSNNGSGGGSGGNSGDPSRTASPVRFQPPLTLPGHLAQMSSSSSSSSLNASASASSLPAPGSSHILPVGVVGGVHGRGLQNRGSQSGGYTPFYGQPPLRLGASGGVAQPLQPQMMSKSVGHSVTNSGNVTFKGVRPPAPLSLPGVGRVSREEEESASQRAREAAQQSQWTASQQQQQQQQQQHHHQSHPILPHTLGGHSASSHAHMLSHPHLPTQYHSHQQQQQHHSPQPHPHILSPLAKSPSQGLVGMGSGGHYHHHLSPQQLMIQQHQQLQQQQQYQQQMRAMEDSFAPGGAGPAAYQQDSNASSVTLPEVDVLQPSTSVLPVSSAHRRISSLPLYVSAKKPRAYRTHITYAELGGVVKENSIGGGKSAAEALASLTRPLAAAADASLIDDTAGRLFRPQRHTQAYKSHFQKKSHQAVFALFAAIERRNDGAGAGGEESVSSAQPFSSDVESSSSDPDVGLFYAQFFRSHFIEMMEAHFPQSSTAALAMLGANTDRTTVSSLPGGGLSADETKIALHGVMQQCIRAMESEAHRLYPSAQVIGAGCAFCVLLVSGGILYTYNSSFITSAPPPALASPGDANAAAAAASTTAGAQVVAVTAGGSGGIVRLKSHTRGGSGSSPVFNPSLFQVMLCRAGRGIDLSFTNLSSGGGGGGGGGVAGGSTDLSSLSVPDANHSCKSPSSSSSGSALAGSFGFNNLLLASSSPRLPSLGGAEVVVDRQLAPQDDFVLMSFTPLAPPKNNNNSSSSAPVPPTPFADTLSLCQTVQAACTPQATIDRLVEVQARMQAAVAKTNDGQNACCPPMLLTLVYF